MNWILAHSDAILFTLLSIIAIVSYYVGKEAGYVEGLEDGFSDGKLNG